MLQKICAFRIAKVYVPRYLYFFLSAEIVIAIVFFWSPLVVLMRSHCALFALYMLVKAWKQFDVGRFGITIRGLFKAFLAVVLLSAPLPFISYLQTIDRGFPALGASLILSGAICIFAERQAFKVWGIEY